MSEKPRRMSRREAWRAMGQPDSGQRLVAAWEREAEERERPQQLRQAEAELQTLRANGRRLN